MVKRKYLSCLLTIIFFSTIFQFYNANANPWLPKPRQYAIYGFYNLTSSSTIKKQKLHKSCLEEIKSLISDVKGCYLREISYIENIQPFYHQRCLQKQRIRSLKSALLYLDYMFYNPQSTSLALIKLIKFNLANNLLSHSHHVAGKDRLICSAFF